MAYHPLTDNFRAFFTNINPDPGKISRAAAEHSRITSLIEDRSGPARVISPRCFLQGSYKQQTAIHDINDVDVIALCELWQPGSGSSSGESWDRDRIFSTIASAIQRDARYSNAVAYSSSSMCIKVIGEVKIEILPVVFAAGTFDASLEPFRLYRPSEGGWADGFARYHQGWLSDKNQASRTDGHFIPAIKALKHLRTRFNMRAVSFHIECLLYSLPDSAFAGGPADYLSNVFSHIASSTAEDWYQRPVMTPCGDRDIFTSSEWTKESWSTFHDLLVRVAGTLQSAVNATDKSQAIQSWQMVLGGDEFPRL